MQRDQTLPLSVKGVACETNSFLVTQQAGEEFGNNTYYILQCVMYNMWDLVGVQCLVSLYRATWYVERMCKGGRGGATLGLGLVDYASIILGIIGASG